jgi:hypothetical protein
MCDAVHTRRSFALIIRWVSEHSSLPHDWPRRLQRRIAWTLAAKLLALMLLWTRKAAAAKAILM